MDEDQQRQHHLDHARRDVEPPGAGHGHRHDRGTPRAMFTQRQGRSRNSSDRKTISAGTASNSAVAINGPSLTGEVRIATTLQANP
jgi:hypothetical protein